MIIIALIFSPPTIETSRLSRAYVIQRDNMLMQNGDSALTVDICKL